QLPYVATLSSGALVSAPQSGLSNEAAEPPEPTVFGVPLSELAREELIKYELHPLDAWERLLSVAERDAPPEPDDVFRFKFHGLFYVAPAQDAFMVRVRVPGNALRADQLRALAGIADEHGDGFADVTTRGNLQLRNLPPRSIVAVLSALHDAGLTSRGSGADNVRNISASPSAGLDPEELLDTRPFARALQFYLLNHRELYGLPRKFNVSFDGGGRSGTVAETNDLAFVAVRLRASSEVRFRVLLGGLPGHGRLAQDAGLALAPRDAVATAAALLRIYNEHGDRSDRTKARFVYLLERWGLPRMLDELRSRVAFELPAVALEDCEPRRPIDRRAHLGVHAQADGRAYLGVALGAGRLQTVQMRALATVAERFGDGELRTTVWQNVLVPGIAQEHVAAARALLLECGLGCEREGLRAGLVACTGNTGCRFSATDTKRHALAFADELDALLAARGVALEETIGINVTGCPHSCAQHGIAEIGLLGT
ncbi:MAG: NirA family protein, partial [Candidatus Dormibacteria bacterium]